MDDKLKKRIAQINAGTAPAGYKKTASGIIPVEWKNRNVGEYLTESREKGNKGDIAKKLTVKLWNKGVVEKNEIHRGSENTQYYVRKAGQFIYSKLDFLNCAFGIIPDELDRYETTLDLPCFDISGINPYYLLSTVTQRRFYEKWGVMSANGGRKARRISPEDFLEMPIPFPPLPEQQKIAEILTAQDAVIALMQKQIELKQQQKKYLMQKLLSGEVRVGDGEWKKTALKELIAPQSRYTDDLDNYPLYSLTIESGVIPKPEQYERSHLVKKENGYKIVMPNEFVYNPMNIRFGAVARHKCDFPVAVSGYYDIFEVKYPSDYVFFDNYLVSYNMLNYYDRVSTGSLIEKKRVHFSQFLEFKFYLPDKEERKQISEILSAQDKEIELLQQQLALEQQKKKAFMHFCSRERCG